MVAYHFIFCFLPRLSFAHRQIALIIQGGGRIQEGERWWSVYVSPSQSKGRMFEAHHDSCWLLEGETALPSPENQPKKFLSRAQQRYVGSYVGPFLRG